MGRWAAKSPRYLLEIAAIAAAYVVFAEMGFSLAGGVKQVTAIWPPAGIAVAALLLFGYRVWPGVFIGAFIANALTGEPWFTAAGIAIGNTLGPLLGAFLLRRFVKFDNALERVRDVIGLALLGSLVAMTVTATNGVSNLALAGIVPWTSFWMVWRVWWAGDAMGVLVFAPLILTWCTPTRRIERPKGGLLEGVILGAALLATTWLAFVSGPRLAYPVYPFFIWIALRFSQRATATAVVAVSVIAIWGAVHAQGPFSGSLDQRLVFLITFVAVLALTGLILGAVSAERELADAGLRQTQHTLRGREAELEIAERRFQVLAETVPQMVWTSDATGWIDWYNHRWYEYTGQTQDEAAGWGWQRAHHPEDFPRVMRDWPGSIASGASFDMELRLRRRDGVFRWFLTRAEPLRNGDGSIVRWYGTNTDIDDQKRAQEQSMLVAQTLQAAFLPAKLPERADLLFDALYLAAGSEALVGGDWYDAFELPDGRIIVSIGDVIGHGLGAAVTAARIRQGIFASALDTFDPAEILARVNRMLQLQEHTVATALVGILDRDLATLRYASAGHPPPIVAGPTIPAQSLPYGSIPLGVSASLDAHDREVALERDAVILFYTDGITEFKRDIEGAERVLLDAVARLVNDRTVAHPAAAIQRAVMGSEKPTDDVALMVLRLSDAESAPVPAEPHLRKNWTFHSSDAYSAHASRHELISFIGSFAVPEEQLFEAELVLGEVLANTVEHAPGIVDIEIDWTGANPIVTVVDTGPGLARLTASLPADGLSEKGRGLFLIATLAADVSVESAHGQGTTLRLTLPVARNGAVA